MDTEPTYIQLGYHSINPSGPLNLDTFSSALCSGDSSNSRSSIDLPSQLSMATSSQESSQMSLSNSNSNNSNSNSFWDGNYPNNSHSSHSSPARTRTIHSQNEYASQSQLDFEMTDATPTPMKMRKTSKGRITTDERGNPMSEKSKQPAVEGPVIASFVPVVQMELVKPKPFHAAPYQVAGSNVRTEWETT
jgi:hypothetical protein